MATKWTDLAADASVQGDDEFVIRNAADGVFAKTTAEKIKTFIGATVSSAWGGITGTLSDQTDLQGELDDKENTLGFTPEDVANKDTDGTLAADSDTLYASQKATKTYVDTSIGAIPSVVDASTTVKGISKLSTAPASATEPIAVGDNDSRNSDARTPTAHSHPQSDVTDLVTDLSAKQATLVSATNIKTINSTSLLGSGDIAVQASLGFTAENVANKENTTIDTSATKYPTVNLLKTGLDLKKTDSMATNKLLGRSTAATGVIEEITLGTGLSFTGTTLNAAAGAGDALVANPLSQFASTTSAQLRGVLSDENGTGVALFDSSTSATFITPILGAATATSINKLILSQTIDSDASVFVGKDAGLNFPTGAIQNTFLGFEAGKGGSVTTAADNNTAIGYRALFADTSGNSNTASGMDALLSNTTGSRNTANGYRALRLNTSANENTAVGESALRQTTTGYNNTAIGFEALMQNTDGNFNAAIGAYTLQNNTTGTNNTALGYAAEVGSGTLTNATAIGNGAIVRASNTMQMGNASVVAVITRGNMITRNQTLSAINSTGTATAAQIVSGYITSTSASATTITTPTATQIATAIAGTPVQGTSLYFSIDNSAGASTITLALDASITVNTPAITGGDSLTITTANSIALFRIVFTNGTTAKIFRIH